MSDLSGRVAIVTGAASGIGRETARQMAMSGASVMVADIDADAAETAAGEIRDSGGAARPFAVDVADPEGVRELVEDTIAAWGRVDVLCNNAATAGHVTDGGDIDIVDMDLDTWDRILAVNLRGPMLCSRYAIPEMERAGGGSIINVSSVAGLAGQSVHPAYGASKGGLNTLTKYLATTYGHRGIRCNAIAPGVIMTPALETNVPPDIVDIYARHTLVPRLGSVEDIASLALFLASEAAGFITGQVISADGGLLVHVPQYADLRDRSEPPPDARG